MGYNRERQAKKIEKATYFGVNIDAFICRMCSVVFGLKQQCSSKWEQSAVT